jgi:hypothetical protein
MEKGKKEEETSINGRVIYIIYMNYIMYVYLDMYACMYVCMHACKCSDEKFKKCGRQDPPTDPPGTPLDKT